MASTIDQMIGRDEMDDIEAILSVSNTDVDELLHAVRSNSEPFHLDYDKGSRPKLDRLYEKAKHSMWNAQTDLPWETEVDQQKLVEEQKLLMGPPLHTYADLKGTAFEKWSQKEWDQLAIEGQNWTLSQFLHGEQGALVCTAKVVESVPWIDAKYYGATQVMDEARHVEVFAKYLDEKLSGHYPINAHLRLLRTTSSPKPVGHDLPRHADHGGGPRLAAFGFMHALTTSPC